jgi:hypothetical protein
MLHIPMDVHEVFAFSSDEKDFVPTRKFADDLTASASPFVIMLVGNGRAGKSTRANQLVQHQLNCDSPFEALSGSEPVTMKFQYCGPFKFGQLSQIHGIPLQVGSDPDIFLIDCEGLHALGKSTAVLKQATFALSQLVSMTVLVMKDLVNHDNVESVRSLFDLSHAFSRHLPGFEIGTTIMMREVGIRYPRGKTLTLDQKDQLRQQSDVKQRGMILDVLNRARVAFSEDDLLVLAQPTFDDPDLYWKSINDFLFFAVHVAEKRKPISGKSLLALFGEAKPSIMAITDFSNPSIPFEQIMQNITNRYLKEAQDIAIAAVEPDVRDHMALLNSGSLRAGIDIYFVADAVVRCIRAFEIKAEELFPNALGYSPENTEKYRQSIKENVESISNTLFVKQCISVLIPDLRAEIVKGIVDAIDVELRSVPIENIGVFPFTDLSSRYEESAIGQFEIASGTVHRGILTSPEFKHLIAELRKQVSNHVKDVEVHRKQEHAQYIAEAIARENQRREAQYQADLQKMEEEEAAKRKQLQKERDEAERLRQEGEARSRVQMEQNRALMEQQLAQGREHAQAMQAMQEKASQEQQAVVNKIMEESRQSEERAAAQHAQEMRMQAERDKRLVEQIEQLRNRPPMVSESGGRRFCNVF